jgi:hypothetical protein
MFVAVAVHTACVPNEPTGSEESKSSAPARAAPGAAGDRKPKPTQRPKPSPGLHAPPPSAEEETAGERPADPGVPPAAEDPFLTEPFVDAFDRDALGEDWHPTSPVWKIDDGKLCGQRARNHPVWLKRRLPTNARIEFDAMSSSRDGDLKVEIWGDGRSHATGTTYDHASSYLAIFGGWKNRFHVLARKDEHAKDRPEIAIDEDSDDLRARRVEPLRTYHFKIERSDGKTVRWYVDDVEMLTYPDKEPLKGPGHEHFGFNDWDVRVCFDNVHIAPL